MYKKMTEKYFKTRHKELYSSFDFISRITLKTNYHIVGYLNHRSICKINTSYTMYMTVHFTETEILIPFLYSAFLFLFCCSLFVLEWIFLFVPTQIFIHVNGSKKLPIRMDSSLPSFYLVLYIIEHVLVPKISEILLVWG
jgi:hypothetical protein